jgi:hypothetical protein
MIHEEAPAVVDEAQSDGEEVDAVEDVYVEAPPIDEYRLSTRAPVVGGGS